MNISIPEFALVVLVGPSGSGKSTFAQRHFQSTEVLSSDQCRGWVSDDENDQSASDDAFEILHALARKRLARGRLTVIDATNVREDARRPLVAIAREFHALPVAITFEVPRETCLQRNAGRNDRAFGAHVVRSQHLQMRRSIKAMKREGFRQIARLRSAEDAENSRVSRIPLWNNRRFDSGPFDIVGDVHGCLDELNDLLDRLGYTRQPGQPDSPLRTHPGNRRLVFVGDLVDRGPDTPGVLELVMNLVRHNVALCVPGNHDIKLLRALNGKQVRVSHGLEHSLAQLAARPPEFHQEVIRFLDGLVSHYVLDHGRLVVAHAGLRAELQGRASGAVRQFCLYGETTGETDEWGLPERLDWALDYSGQALVVHGHTPVDEPRRCRRTINIDTGCVFGGALTAYRYPEDETVSIPARRVHAEATRPSNAATKQESAASSDGLIDLADVTGRRHIVTRLRPGITVPAENNAAALEIASRFAVDPRWLFYLPPTMAPTATSTLPDMLEHPAEALDYFHRAGVTRVVCQEKHMGSRAVVIVGRSPSDLTRVFGVPNPGNGVILTRSGRPFFRDASLQHGLLGKLRDAVARAGLFEELDSAWLCLDAELLPWSAKAGDLLRSQYAAVAASGKGALGATAASLRIAADRGLPVQDLLANVHDRIDRVERFSRAYGRYCWPVESLDGLVLAPFHVLASQNRTHTTEPHDRHMEIITRIARAADELDPARSGWLRPTPGIQIDPGSETDRRLATEWWLERTDAGSEGMVVKPASFIAKGPHGLVQPALKVRGREYLRIIYGPEYTRPENLARLKARSLHRKRSLALREFALGIEALERFTRGDAPARVHECILAILALETEPVDPRL